MPFVDRAFAGRAFVDRVERVIDEVLARDPALAASAGEHRFDDRLPDWSAAAVADRVEVLRDAAGALSGVDDLELEPAERVDLEQLQALVEATLFDLTEIREHEWNPLVHNPGELLHALVARPFAPAPERLTALAGRLAAIPDALATARAMLRDCPAIHVETAIRQFRGTAAFVRDEAPGLHPAGWAAVEPVATAAIAALTEFADWLPSVANPDRDPRLGRRRWEAKLWHTLDTELRADQVLAQARARLAEVSDEIRAVAASYVGGAATDETVRIALDRLAQERPSNDTIVAAATATLARATDFVRDHELVSLVDDPCLVREMPEFARGVAVAYCDAPGPLESAALPTLYCIAPAPATWPVSRVDSFYREYNNSMLYSLSVHEAMPGHYLQLAHARRYAGSTRARAVARSGTFIEGWGVYAEQLMVAAGFGGVPARLQRLKMMLRTIINAILDQRVHCEDLTEGEAMALMTQRGFQEEGEAAGKWRRALLTSTQLSTYFVGFTEVAAIAAARPTGVAARQWHDEMLAHGSPSPRHLRGLLLGY